MPEQTYRKCPKCGGMCPVQSQQCAACGQVFAVPTPGAPPVRGATDRVNIPTVPAGQQMKVCPVCQVAAVLSAPACRCGHQYRTAFSPAGNQTQAVYVAPAQSWSAPQQTPAVPTGGPKDEAEWKTSAFWHWVGLTIFGGWLLVMIQQMGWFCLVSPTLGVLSSWFMLPGILILGFIVTFLVMRTRRLYLYYAPPGVRWHTTGTMVSVIVGSVLLVQFLINLFIARGVGEMVAQTRTLYRSPQTSDARPQAFPSNVPEPSYSTPQ